MVSNTHSSPGGRSGGRPNPLAAPTADMDELDAQDLTGLSDAALTEQLLRLRRLVDRLEGQWLKELADLEGMVALNGLLDPEGGQTLLAALESLARPADAADDRSGHQRRADALVELARRNLEGGQLPQAGGVRPQLTVVVDLDSLLGQQPALGGEAGWAGPLAPEACQRLACDSAVTRR